MHLPRIQFHRLHWGEGWERVGGYWINVSGELRDARLISIYTKWRLVEHLTPAWLKFERGNPLSKTTHGSSYFNAFNPGSQIQGKDHNKTKQYSVQWRGSVLISAPAPKIFSRSWNLPFLLPLSWAIEQANSLFKGNNRTQKPTM